jgi:TPR repeat protein
MVNLGIMYETGEGVPANAQKAAEMYQQAAEKGDMFAAYKYMQFQELGVVPAPSQEGIEGVSSLVLKQGDVEKPANAGSAI